MNSHKNEKLDYLLTEIAKIINTYPEGKLKLSDIEVCPGLDPHKQSGVLEVIKYYNGTHGVVCHFGPGCVSQLDMYPLEDLEDIYNKVKQYYEQTK